MMPDPALAEPQPEVRVDAYGVRVFGVTYGFRMFRALAARLGSGTHVDARRTSPFDVMRLSDGRMDLYHHRPGR